MKEKMTIRKATEADLPHMHEIYAAARDFMVEMGNPYQWAERNWPPEELVLSDIAAEKSYLCVAEGRTVGTFYFDYGYDIDPTYRVIENGSWAADAEYGVIHRIASDRSIPGIGTFCILWAYEQTRRYKAEEQGIKFDEEGRPASPEDAERFADVKGDLRMDTHGDNKVMQNLLFKLGFEHRGTTYVFEDDFPRMGFEKTE